jgi:hypothetical protein
MATKSERARAARRRRDIERIRTVGLESGETRERKAEESAANELR